VLSEKTPSLNWYGPVAIARTIGLIMMLVSALAKSRRMPLPSAVRNHPWRLGAAVVVAILVIAAIFLLRATLIKQPAPEVVFATLSGQKISLRALRGKVVLVNFWATSCAPCMHEMPRLAESYRELHERGLEIVAVAASYDPPNSVLNYADTRHLPFPVALDIEDKVAAAFGGLKAVPTTYLVGRDGRILIRVEGELEPGELRSMLQDALAAR
jgi:peroxiredoxin